MKNYLRNQYTTPVLMALGTPRYDFKSKRAQKQYYKWFNETFPSTYKDVKEGDVFILYNGYGSPVPFIQQKDEVPDKYNRPTRLNDGQYLTLKPDDRVRISTTEEAVQLKKEVNSYNSQQVY